MFVAICLTILTTAVAEVKLNDVERKTFLKDGEESEWLVLPQNLSEPSCSVYCPSNKSNLRQTPEIMISDVNLKHY